MTNIDKALEFLKENPQSSYCDDCLCEITGILRRAQVNMICRALAAKGQVLRIRNLCSRCSQQKLVNKISGNVPEDIQKQDQDLHGAELASSSDLWCWEGNVQTKLREWLEKEGYEIKAFANTTARSRGVDIIVKNPNGEEVWISVKGYPSTKRHAQARHYFSAAIFDLILYRGESSSAQLAIGLPDGFTTYTNLAKKVQWMRKGILAFDIYWIAKDGQVRKD